MPNAACQHHHDVPVPNKFSLCYKCAREFFERHGIAYDPRRGPVEDDMTEVDISDIVIELDEILLKEGERKTWTSSSRP